MEYRHDYVSHKRFAIWIRIRIHQDSGTLITNGDLIISN